MVWALRLAVSLYVQHALGLLMNGDCIKLTASQLVNL